MKTRSGDRSGKWTRYVLALAAMVAAAGLVVAGGAREAKAANGGTYSFASPSLSVTEGQSINVGVVRSGSAAASVCFSVTGGDAPFSNYSPSSGTVTFPTSDAAEGFTFTAVDNPSGSAVNSGPRTVIYTLTLPCDPDTGIVGSPASVTITINDDDGPGITVAPTSGLVTTEAGGTAQFTVKLNALPSASVTIGLSSSNTSEGTVSPPSLTFTSVNGTTPQTVTVTGVDDGAVDGNIAYTIITAAASSADGNYNNLNANDVSVTNNDNEVAPAIIVTPTSGLTTTEFGGTAQFTVRLSTFPSSNVTIGLTSDDTTEGTVSPSSLTFTSGNGTTNQTVTITGVDDALVDGNIAYTIITAAASSADVNYSGLNGSDVSVSNTDNEVAAGFVVTPTSGLTTTEAGGTAQFSVYLTTLPAANVTISVTSSDLTEGTVSTSSLTFTSVNGTTPQTVTITGVNDFLVDGNVAYAVILGVASSSDGSYNGLNPADVSVTNLESGSGLPTISGVSPSAGPIAGGNTVTITGTNFLGATSVLFGSNLATNLNVLTSTTIVVTAPAASGLVAQTVDVTVTTPSGSDLTVGTADDYTYTGGPTVTLLTPATGPTTGNTFVTVTGTGFTPSGMTVTFGGTAATFAYNSSTSLTAVSPAHSAGTFDVIVTTPGGVSPNTVLDDFIYTGTSAPVITSISPTSGPVGTFVTVTGSGFLGSSVATVGGVSASFTVVNDTTVTLTVPSTTPGGTVDIRVTNSGGTSPNVAADNFNNTSSSGATTTYTLYFRWTLIAWTGIDNLSVYNAVRGIETGTANPNTNDVSGQVTAIWYWDGSSQSYKGFFVGFENVPGANDFTTMKRGISYWVAVASTTTSWTVLVGQ